MAKLLFGLYDYRSKHLGILEEINATTPTNLHLNHFNHEGVVECPRKKKKIHMQRKYNAATFLDDGDLAPFFGSIESRMTPFQEEEDDVHMPSHIYIIESRVTPFQEEDDVDIPRVTQDQASDIQATVHQGPITHSHTKKLQQKMNSLIDKINFNISENVILPKCSTLVVLRYICERGGAAIHGEEAKKKNQVDQFGPRMNQQVQFGQVRTDQIGQSVRTSSDRSVRTYTMI
jgi:hypothetical protein